MNFLFAAVGFLFRRFTILVDCRCSHERISGRRVVKRVFGVNSMLSKGKNNLILLMMKGTNRRYINLTFV